MEKKMWKITTHWEGYTDYWVEGETKEKALEEYQNGNYVDTKEGSMFNDELITDVELDEEVSA